MSSPSSQPPSDRRPQSRTDNRGAIIIHVEADGDTTIRPASPLGMLKRPLRPRQPKPGEDGGPAGPPAPNQDRD